MFIMETLRRSFEQATGRDRPSPRQARQRVVGRRAKTFMFRDDGAIPNNPTLPFVYYRRAVRLVRVADPAAIFEQLFEANGWGDSWRNGIYDYVHYHAHVHEVLGIARGRARVQFGGPKGDDFDLAAGDVAILPAGIGHRCLMASSDFLVVGAYPPGGEYDECRGSAQEYERALRTIPETPLPDKDPVYGDKGPLTRLWKS